MTNLIEFIKIKIPLIIALLAIGAFYGLSRKPTISIGERNQLSSQFQFGEFMLPGDVTEPTRNVRDVAPSLKRISSWISSTGASIALSDLDGDGLSNDYCIVDPRHDRVVVGPVPTTGERFAPFQIESPRVDLPTIAPMGCIPADFNEDGLVDLLVIYWGRTPIIFTATREGDPGLETASFTPQELFNEGDMRWFTGAATVADLDGDSHLDIAIGNYFADGSQILDADAQVNQSMQHSMSRAVNGGQSRILRWAGMTKGKNPRVRFEEVKDYIAGEFTAEQRMQFTRGWTLALGACDLDNDLLPELYFANDFGSDRLLHNRSTPGEIRFVPVVGQKYFTTPNSKVVGRDSFKGMGVDFGDVNGDGVFDFYVSNIAAEYALEESHFLFIGTGEVNKLKAGIAPFVDESESLGVSRSDWAWDTKFGDFNNDGITEIVQATGFIAGTVDRWPELHETAMGNDQFLSDPYSWHRFQPGDALSGDAHTTFFARASDGRYYDIAPELKLDRKQISRGVSTADVNGDGRLDFAIANQWDASYFYLNKSAQPGNFLGLNLRFPIEDGRRMSIYPGHPQAGIPSRAAVGAWVSVELPGGKRLVSFVDGGNGHSGKRSPEILFGLGSLTSEANLKLEIRWRGAGGKIRSHFFNTRPGWHTILL